MTQKTCTKIAWIGFLIVIIPWGLFYGLLGFFIQWIGIWIEIYFFQEAIIKMKEERVERLIIDSFNIRVSDLPAFPKKDIYMIGYLLLVGRVNMINKEREDRRDMLIHLLAQAETKKTAKEIRTLIKELI